MLFNTRLSPISTVHFKRQLNSPPKLNASTETTTGSSHQTSLSLHPSRLGTFFSPHELTHLQRSCPVHSVYSKALKISAKLAFLREGKQLHGHLVKTGLCNNVYFQGQIINMYVKCHELKEAHQMLDGMADRNVVVWNTLICAGSDCESNFSLGISYFRRMLIESSNPDDITFNSLFRSCTESIEIESGKQLHCFVLKIAFARNCFVGTALVYMYGKLGFVEDARQAFEDVSLRDLVLWNVMVYCYAFNRLPYEAIRVFNSMRLESSFSGDEFTLTDIISSCDREIGNQVHAIAIKLCLDADVMVKTALVDSYSKKSEALIEARKMFDEMKTQKNIVTWNAMISGYKHHGEGKESIKLFRELLRENISPPDKFTLASVTSSCGNSGTSNDLKQIHARALKSGFDSFISVNNAMIKAYSKSGDISDAYRCFGSAVEPDLIAWTSIIFASAFHGLSLQSAQHFEEMLGRGIKPDKITFLGALSACSHGGLVKRGLECFEAMTEKYWIEPSQEHYTCLVDLLGRAGLLDEAFKVLGLIPSEARGNALKAFLGACGAHGRGSGLARRAADELFSSEPSVAANYVALSNVYSSEGLWDDVARIRWSMARNCSPRVSPGLSWVEIGCDVHTFVSWDRSHLRSVELYDMLGLLYFMIREDNI